jgi:coenzyme F420-reducing hydrogenase delta subunit
MHTFTLSGLGMAPFKICSPSDNGAIANQAFFCEHCGTQLRNRFFVSSSDGKVSVVGIDCLKKTGDEGLIAGAKRHIKEQRSIEKSAKQAIQANVRMKLERETFDGMTIEEVSEQCLTAIAKEKARLSDAINELDITSILSKSSFGQNMLEHALHGNTYSGSMIRVMTELVAKHLSGARKGSCAYKTSIPAAEGAVRELTELVTKHSTKIEQFSKRRIEAFNTKIKA